MKRDCKQTSAGFSLIEVVTAITILALLIVPIGSSLVLSHRLNTRSERLLQEQLAVSSVVESLMATGIQSDKIQDNQTYPADSDVAVQVNKLDNKCYLVTVSSSSGDVQVKTYIREAVNNHETAPEESA